MIKVFAGKLAYFKVPRRIMFVEEIPKGPTGKLQRTSLAKQLGLSGGIGIREAPRAGGEDGLGKWGGGTAGGIAGLMTKALGGTLLGPDENFFEAGGDSIQAAAFLADLEHRFGVDVPVGVFVVNATVRRLAVIVESGASNGSRRRTRRDASRTRANASMSRSCGGKSAFIAPRSPTSGTDRESAMRASDRARSS